MPSLPAAVAEVAAAETEREVIRLPGAKPCLHVSPYLQEYVRGGGGDGSGYGNADDDGCSKTTTRGLWHGGKVGKTKSDDR